MLTRKQSRVVTHRRVLVLQTNTAQEAGTRTPKALTVKELHGTEMRGDEVRGRLRFSWQSSSWLHPCNQGITQLAKSALPLAAFSCYVLVRLVFLSWRECFGALWPCSFPAGAFKAGRGSHKDFAGLFPAKVGGVSLKAQLCFCVVFALKVKEEH